MTNRTKIKIETLEKRLANYYEAEEKILNAQSYSLGSRTLTRANLKEVQSKIKELENQIDSLKKHGTTKSRIVRVVPLDR